MAMLAYPFSEIPALDTSKMASLESNMRKGVAKIVESRLNGLKISKYRLQEMNSL